MSSWFSGNIYMYGVLNSELTTSRENRGFLWYGSFHGAGCLAWDMVLGSFLEEVSWI